MCTSCSGIKLLNKKFQTCLTFNTGLDIAPVGVTFSLFSPFFHTITTQDKGKITIALVWKRSKHKTSYYLNKDAFGRTLSQKKKKKWPEDDLVTLHEHLVIRTLFYLPWQPHWLQPGALIYITVTLCPTRTCIGDAEGIGKNGVQWVRPTECLLMWQCQLVAEVAMVAGLLWIPPCLSWIFPGSLTILARKKFTYFLCILL